MSGNYLANPLTFLISTLFSLYILALMLRFLLQWVGADPRNPISQVLIRVTQPVLQPLRRYLPAIGGADTASIVLMLIVQFVAVALVFAIRGIDFNLLFMALMSLGEVIKLMLNVVLVVVIIRVLISWAQAFGIANPDTSNPALRVIDQLAEAAMAPVQRILPPMGGLDLSPLVVLIGIQLIKMLVLGPSGPLPTMSMMMY